MKKNALTTSVEYEQKYFYNIGTPIRWDGAFVSEGVQDHVSNIMAVQTLHSQMENPLTVMLLQSM